MVGDRLAGANHEMVDPTATEFFFDVRLIQMLSTTMCDEGSAGFRFLCSQKTAATQVVFRGILHLEHDAIVLLSHSLQRDKRLFVVEVTKHNE